MSIEHGIVLLYLALCVALGVYASRRVLTSADEYWVAGRRIGPWMNSLAIMASLASGGSVIGVMGLAFARGVPSTLALFAGAVVGFPLAAILVAGPLRRFGRFTITDFLTWRYPSLILKVGVPLLIVASFTVYIVAQLKAAGITAEALLGIDYETALLISTVVFVLYVSIGGMLAVTWTDVAQGGIMLLVVVGLAALLVSRFGAPVGLLDVAVDVKPAIGDASAARFESSLGSFLIWAAAIPVIPHIVMRVYTAKDVDGARFSLNLAMVFYCVLILAAVFVIVPVAVVKYPLLEDPDLVFHNVVAGELPPILRGLAVAAVIAAVMSTTDALLLACSSAIAHDLISQLSSQELSANALHRINIAVVWCVGAVAVVLAWNPPGLIAELYSAAIGVLSASLFVPVVAGIWWKRANRIGGVAAFVVGAIVYLFFQFRADTPPMSAILFGLPASLLAMIVGSLSTQRESNLFMEDVRALHRDKVARRKRPDEVTGLRRRD